MYILITVIALLYVVNISNDASTTSSIITTSSFQRSISIGMKMYFHYKITFMSLLYVDHSVINILMQALVVILLVVSSSSLIILLVCLKQKRKIKTRKVS